MEQIKSYTVKYRFSGSDWVGLQRIFHTKASAMAAGRAYVNENAQVEVVGFTRDGERARVYRMIKSSHNSHIAGKSFGCVLCNE